MKQRRSASSWQSVKTSSNWSTTSSRRASIGGASRRTRWTATRSARGSSRRSRASETAARPSSTGILTASSSIGCEPGVMTTVFQERLPSKAPSTAPAAGRPAPPRSCRFPRGRRREERGISQPGDQTGDQPSRPKKNWASLGWKAARPLNRQGTSVGARRSPGVTGGWWSTTAGALERRSCIEIRRFSLVSCSRSRSCWPRCSASCSVWCRGCR
jgi:hypothetical protein